MNGKLKFKCRGCMNGRLALDGEVVWCDLFCQHRAADLLRECDDFKLTAGNMTAPAAPKPLPVGGANFTLIEFSMPEPLLAAVAEVAACNALGFDEAANRLLFLGLKLSLKLNAMNGGVRIDTAALAIRLDALEAGEGAPC